jgi:fatty-acyl-CoA synthase
MVPRSGIGRRLANCKSPRGTSPRTHATTSTVDERRAALEEQHPQWPGWTLAGALDAAATRHPQRPAVIGEHRTWTYRELAERSAALARGLVAAGVGRGEHVALLMPNGPELIALFFAIARAGAVAVPVNVLLRARELEHVLRQSDSVGLIAAERFRDLDHRAHIAELAPQLPDLRFVAWGADQLERDPDPALDAELDARAAAASADDTATVFYTSGTSGQPKGVVLTHDMELRSAYGSALTRGFEDGRRILFALPLSHVFAYVEGLLAALFVGGAVVVQSRFDPAGTLAAIEREGASEALFVPTMSLAVIDAARAGGHDVSSLHSIMSAAAPAPARLWHELRELLGLEQLLTAYGMTETAAATTFTMPDDPIERLVGTVGRPKRGGVAGELVAYKVVDPFDGTDLKPGTEGELAARGAIVSRGYYRKLAETAAALTPDGWLRSGDLARIDADGYVMLTGRSKELYKCGAEAVMPRQVEARLTEHPEVAQAYVVGVPDERMGEVGCAFVVPAADRRPSPEALIAHCRAGLARFKVPELVVFIAAEELPLTASGKVQKFKLAERVRS